MKKSVYIFSDGALQRKDNTLFFEGEQGKKFLPVEDINELMVMGEVSLNKKFLEFVSQKEILVHYFNYHGYYMGTFYPREHLNSGYMILKQAEHYSDSERRMMIAKGFVTGAAKNIKQVLKYYGNRGKDLDEIINRIEELLELSSNSKDVNELMAFEGNIRDHYYKAFDLILDDSDFAFDQRSRRPPLNYLNCLISFGNSLLYTIVLSEIYQTHLDPRIGFLHATNFRRFSLNLDVAEIFKPIIIDRLIFTLISKKMITKKDFEKETEGIILKEQAKKTFVEELDKRLKTTIKHRKLPHEVSYRRLIRLELYKLEKHLMGEEEYNPFIAQW
ncbi:type I-B CRISPR-associated endonuclease Cas1b [Candidatus Formimonas warabiya]|uniref:CRISPR-associated endonuclease Cas1 n=1 Tax=Formimonas warabiya TaxID=1761012 RepID=A0A3G1KY74_FORW1|nr:type I-B CRISPR-associated endonuclease Cas1b [Candidatus Formimonas warabiya]ATW27428.1 subtype I-B CRISPR-associated endonuclease Cas1 [Candidatus Formimonas warabiya]